MPKLRERKAKSDSKRGEADTVQSTGCHQSHSRWTPQEKQALLLAVKRHGTSSLAQLQSAVPSRSESQIHNRLTAIRREWAQQEGEFEPLPLDGWMERIGRAMAEPPAFCTAERLDVPAVSVPLRLAAEQERRLAAAHGREDLSDVYLYLAHLANGSIPPEPSEATARRLVALMHHLAALVNKISLSRHKRWLWCDQRIRELGNPNFRPREEDGRPSEEAADLSLVPAELRAALSGLLAPKLNYLRTPPPLLLSPLSTQLDEAATGDKHTLLSKPVSFLLADASCRGWNVSTPNTDGVGAMDKAQNSTAFASDDAKSAAIAATAATLAAMTGAVDDGSDSRDSFGPVSLPATAGDSGAPGPAPDHSGGPERDATLTGLFAALDDGTVPTVAASVPSLDDNKPGRMTEVQLNAGPSFAVKAGAGAMRVYSRKRPRQ